MTGLQAARGVDFKVSNGRDPGTRLGPYEIFSLLGAGGMGEVYRARDTRLDRTVAIKVLSQHLSSSAEVRQRFEREATTISQLSHPHICVLYDVGREGETVYLVMEYLEGETLSDRLAGGALPLEQTLPYGIEIADSLDKAHHDVWLHGIAAPPQAALNRSFERTQRLRGPAAQLHRWAANTRARCAAFRGLPFGAYSQPD